MCVHYLKHFSIIVLFTNYCAQKECFVTVYYFLNTADVVSSSIAAYNYVYFIV